MSAATDAGTSIPEVAPDMFRISTFDREREEIVLLYPGDLLRELPEHTLEIAVDAPERRTL